MSMQKIVGVLALQGDFEAHERMLQNALGAKTRLVKTCQELEEADGLVLPGGESTTIVKLMQRIGLYEAIQQRSAEGMPLYGTCAGMILLARSILAREDQPTLGLLDVEVARNAFGRQIDSFEADIPMQLYEGARHQLVHGVFIRAPYITRCGAEVSVLGRYQEKVVAVRQQHILATAFHPELTDDAGVHRYFLQMIEQSQEKRSRT